MEGLAVAFGPVAYRNPDDSQLYWDLQYVMGKLMENGEQNALTKHARTLKDLCFVRGYPDRERFALSFNEPQATVNKMCEPELYKFKANL